MRQRRVGRREGEEEEEGFFMYPATFIYHQQWRRVEAEELVIFAANTRNIIAPNPPPTPTPPTPPTPSISPFTAW